MRTTLSFIVIGLLSFSAMAEHHEADNADLHAAIKAFDRAYASNDVEKYFSFYADDATAFFWWRQAGYRCLSRNVDRIYGDGRRR